MTPYSVEVVMTDSKGKLETMSSMVTVVLIPCWVAVAMIPCEAAAVLMSSIAVTAMTS